MRGAALFTGTLPSQIGQLESLFFLHLNDNSFTGTIPTELGSITGLRRAWMYGNHLHGTVPTELGNLKILEVFEIYGNKLEGTVPQGVCDSIAAATYDYKNLAADCKKVSCEGCCTTCY